MHHHPAKLEIDLSKYAPNINDPEAFYGLPRDVAFCKKCVISNQRPNSAVEFTHTIESNKKTINFDADGVCDACRLAEQKQGTINWAERERQLR